MTHYLAVTELEKAYLAVLVNCREFYLFELERDEGEIEALMAAEEEFMNNVKNDTPPAVDGAKSTSEAISAIYPESDDSEVDLMAYESTLRVYQDFGEQIKRLQDMRDEAANKIKAYMGTAGVGNSDNFKVSFKSAERKTFDAKRFARENPSVDLAPYYNTSNYRTFKVTERG